MLPKRKFIKKIHRRQEEAVQANVLQPATLLQKLRTRDSIQVEEALAFVSSMCLLPQGAEQLALLAELVGVLQRGYNAEVYQCLYALANLVELDPKIVPRLFSIGLHKALLQLNSNDKDLLRPILSLMMTLHSHLPQQFKYLEGGVQQSLNVGHLCSSSRQDVLQFLVRVEGGNLRGQMYEKMYQFFKNQQSLRIRALCAAIMMRNRTVRERTGKELLQFCDEVVGDIDLQKEYQTNIIRNKPLQKPKQLQTDMMEQEEEPMPTEHANYDTFSEAVQAVDTLLEAMLILFEEALQEQFEQQELQGEEEIEQIQEQPKQAQNQPQQNFSLAFINYFTARPDSLARNTLLTFIEGQNIVHLSVRVLGYCTSIPRQSLSIIVIKCLQNSLVASPPQILEEILGVGLHMLLKSPIPIEARSFLLTLGQNVLQLKESYRDSWHCLLEIYSIQFNPQRCPVSVEENRRVGAILKQLILNIPCLSLQQWRGQTIDTIFDVFSNQQFDEYLVQLGLLPIFEQIVLQAGAGKKKKFIRQVLTDMKRFLEYKRKRIKF